jgi:hypothetical protein
MPTLLESLDSLATLLRDHSDPRFVPLKNALEQVDHLEYADDAVMSVLLKALAEGGCLVEWLSGPDPGAVSLCQEIERAVKGSRYRDRE